MKAALITAKKTGHDVFNCLDIMDNKTIVEVPPLLTPSGPQLRPRKREPDVLLL
jgi:hypothetical protein